MDLGIAMFVGLLVQCSSSNLVYSKNHSILTTDWIALKFGTAIHGPQRMNPNNFHNSLTFHLAFPLVNFFSSSQDASKSNDQTQPQS